MIKKYIVLALCLAVSISFAGCSGKGAENGGTEGNSSIALETADTAQMNFEFTDRDKDPTYQSADATVTLSGSGGTVSGSGVTADSSGITVTAAGSYVFSGSITGCPIIVAAGDNDKVQLVFNNVSISNPNGPAVYIKSGDKVFITLEDNSINTLSDGDTYTLTDGDTTVDAALFSRSDLTINGSGELIVNGNSKHGIVSKDDLVITGGAINVQAANVGICGKDCVKTGECTLNITAGSDGIRSDNTEDASRGYVYVENTNINITAANDGIQAETVLKVVGGGINIKTGSGSGASLSYNSESMKGLKAGSDILISGGDIQVDSVDDCVHSNNTISITGGTFALASGDDGIHADTDLSVSGGKIQITQSYEGLEGSRIIISGGEIDLVASDDGLNAAGGNDSSAIGGRPGQGMFTNSTGSIVISGGYTLINSYGDGIDSNGTLEVIGGVTLVSGPTNNGNGAFDYDSSATANGGVLIALGTNGMAQGFSDAENQGAILCSFSAQNAGTSFALVNENGAVVASFTPAKAYQSAVITAPGLTVGGTYTVVAGGTVNGADQNGYAQNATISGGSTLLTVEMNSEIYGNSNGMGPMTPGGMMPGGGMRPGRR